MKSAAESIQSVGGVYQDLFGAEVEQWTAYIVAQPEWAAYLEAEIGVERAKRIVTEDASAAVTALLSAQAAVSALASTWIAAALAARPA